MIEDIEPGKVWDALVADPKAQVCDVRTDAEWNFVGIPDLHSLGREPVLIPWQVYPTMQRNGGFLDHLREAGLTPETPIYFLCRSGARSLAAAQAAAAAGFTQVYNIADGFEGPLDPEGHRGKVGGWKAQGLPWQQR
ncbi:rhodanese-like domain-containing protein [Acidisoma silvae]|uniref:Rhodanese-like domain-containing protein n=1 Tax=Acidisoma silvae TaxID=2802396 RepID=A0A964DY20_9PROT|nr:rhodanese-like domain-containing protein [Acidisoma silvae]MCB8874816.1 rhodanese-like domain-containing protein [Acidisoma silvae]